MSLPIIVGAYLTGACFAVFAYGWTEPRKPKAKDYTFAFYVGMLWPLMAVIGAGWSVIWLLMMAGRTARRGISQKGSS